MGTLHGHVLPGCLMLSWATWWAASSAAEGRWRWGRRAEPWLKILLPLLGLYIELYGDHDHYIALTDGAGNIVMDHLHNWQHAASYPLFIASGLVDLTWARLRLPSGARDSVLALAFGAESFLMLLHTKEEPVDQTVHQLLGWTMAVCAAAIAAHAATKHAAVALLRSVAVAQQGLWLCVIGLLMYTRTGLRWQVPMLLPPLYVAALLWALFCEVAVWAAVAHRSARHKAAADYQETEALAKKWEEEV